MIASLLSAYSDAEIASRSCATLECDTMLDWSIRGTSLVASTTLKGVPHDVEVETTMHDGCITEWAIDVTRLEPAEREPNGGPYVVIEGRSFKRRHLHAAENRALFTVLHADAGSFIESHSYSLVLAHEAELGEQRAERVREFADLIGVGP